MNAGDVAAVIYINHLIQDYANGVNWDLACWSQLWVSEYCNNSVHRMEASWINELAFPFLFRLTFV